MDVIEASAARRPKRWDEPMDGSMNDSEVAWLRSRQPFASMNPKSFPRGTPLDGILRYDSRLFRTEPGEIIFRPGDTGRSAYLVLAGSVQLIAGTLSPRILAHAAFPKRGFVNRLRALILNLPRTMVSVRVKDSADPLLHHLHLIRVDGRPAVILKNFDEVLREHETIGLGPGQWFGNVAKTCQMPFSATIIAENEAALLEIRAEGMMLLHLDATFSSVFATSQSV